MRPIKTAAPSERDSPDSRSPDSVAVSLEGVCFAFPRGLTVLKDVSASLGSGRITAIVGPNAAGKTTLLRLMLGQIGVLKGKIEVGGKAVGGLSAAQRARIVSYVPQRGASGFAFSVRQVVTMGRHALGPDPAAVDRALAQTQIQDLAHRPFTELSVGQQQRVLLARALAQSADAVTGPRAMLLDEPTSAMDPAHVHQTMTILREQAQRGLAVGIVLHDLNLAIRYADDAWLLSDTRLVAAGAWDEVLTADRLAEVYGLPFDVLQPDAGGRPLLYAHPVNGIESA